MSLFSSNIKQSISAQWLWLTLTLILMGGGMAFDLYLEYLRTENAEKDRLTTQVRVIAENIEHQLLGANLALESVRDELPTWKNLSSSRVGIAHLKALTNAMQGIRFIGIVDGNGILQRSNLNEFAGQNFAYRDYFKAAKQNPGADTLFVSPPFKSATGSFVLNVTRMIPDKQGKFDGVITASLDPVYFKTLMTSVLYAPDMWDAVAHGDGDLFLMSPEREGLSGMNLAEPGSLFTRHRDSGQMVTTMTGTVYSTKEEGMMMVQRTVRPEGLKMDKPLVVSACRNLGAIFRPWRRVALLEMGVFALFAVISALGLYFYQRSQREFEQKRSEVAAALQLSEERLKLAAEASGIGVWDYDMVSNALVWDDSMYALYGIDKSDGSGLFEMWSNMVLPEDVPLAEAALKATLESGVPYTPCFRIRRGDGEVRYIQARAKIYFDDDGKPLRIVGTNEDITERKKLQGKLEEKAHQDYLTGLCNRRYFMELGQAELARAQRYGSALSMLMIDIDFFKAVNDSHGHKVGDIVLQKLSDIMRETLRTMDIIGRIGGEEFAILLPETDLGKASEVAERLRENVENTEVILEAGLPLHFTVSIGVATLKGKDANIDILFNQSDKALYQAKESGRNRVCAA
jgi:diguanylate cyclase (GGDEF)-like protein/PAS domain S-box-containing protein